MDIRKIHKVSFLNLFEVSLLHSRGEKRIPETGPWVTVVRDNRDRIICTLVTCSSRDSRGCTTSDVVVVEKLVAVVIMIRRESPVYILNVNVVVDDFVTIRSYSFG